MNLLLRNEQSPGDVLMLTAAVRDGGGVQSLQIDLYWGHDNPMGPGGDVFRPAGTTFTEATRTTVILLADTE